MHEARRGSTQCSLSGYDRLTVDEFATRMQAILFILVVWVTMIVRIAPSVPRCLLIHTMLKILTTRILRMIMAVCLIYIDNADYAGHTDNIDSTGIDDNSDDIDQTGRTGNLGHTDPTSDTDDTANSDTTSNIGKPDSADNRG